MEAALEDRTGALDGARAFVEEVRDERQGEYGEKLERREEERGKAAAWLAEWEGAGLGGVGLEPPGSVDEPDFEHADNLSEEAE